MLTLRMSLNLYNMQKAFEILSKDVILVGLMSLDSTSLSLKLSLPGQTLNFLVRVGI